MFDVWDWFCILFIGCLVWVGFWVVLLVGLWWVCGGYVVLFSCVCLLLLVSVCLLCIRVVVMVFVCWCVNVVFVFLCYYVGWLGFVVYAV